jgi:hypothetical protein
MEKLTAKAVARSSSIKQYSLLQIPQLRMYSSLQSKHCSHQHGTRIWIY